MKKIKKIEIENYRGFYTTETIIVEGKNLLIYGENGSGKSSLYRALEDFFNSKSRNIFTKNIHQTTNNGKIDLTFFEGNPPIETKLSFSNTVFIDESFVTDVAKQNPFFTYKRVLRTFLFDEQDSLGKILFKLLVEEILHNYELQNNKDPNQPKKEKLGDIWIKFKSDTDKSNINPKVRFYDWQDSFNEGIKINLEKLSEKTNVFLEKYFKQNVKISLSLKENFNIIDKASAKKQIINNEILISVELFGKVIPEHHDFLNEARLSALAICMYLASLKVIPAPTDLKILFLDDIFIGLDMSNRLPLLDILKSEFSEYQIFMTTYDRAWFELAKDHLDNNKWKTIEMYVGKNEIPEFDVPVIIQSKDYVARAKEHFNAFDYPACANYLRKACEKLIKDFLPKNLKYTQDTKQVTITEITDLETLFNNLIKYLTSQNLDKTPFDDFKTYKKVVFNALSHDDLKSPIYKKELTDSFGLVENLQKLKLLGEIEENTILYLSLKNPNTNVIHEYEIQLIEKLRFLEQDTKKIWSKSFCNVMDINNKKIYWEKKSLQEIFKNISHSFDLLDTFDVNIWFKEIKSKKIGGKNLQQLINELQP